MTPAPRRAAPPIQRVALSLPTRPAGNGLAAWPGRVAEIEYQWLREHRRDRPLVVFLHEGLGSITMWRGFPAALCEAADIRGLVYSRPGYGGSTGRTATEGLPLDYLDREADIVLPGLLQALGVTERPWLLGHSDGGSIALIRAAHAPEQVAGIIVMAPHLMVEPCGTDSIRAIRRNWDADGTLRSRLARYHTDPDAAFLGWNDIWLSDAFRTWSIEDEIAAIRCPVLAIQGENDEYGTLVHVTGIADRVPGTELLVLKDCGHIPYREHPETVTRAIIEFMRTALT